MAQTAIVNTKSVASSKINWLAAATGLGVLITQFTPTLPPAWQGPATALVGVVGAVATFITRTFYTTTIISNSLPPAASMATVTHAAGTSEEQVTAALNVAQLQNQGTHAS